MDKIPTLEIARSLSQYCSLVIRGFSNFLGLFQVIMANPWNDSPGQIIATSHDLTPNGGLVREIPLFQGNLGWWNIIIWPDSQKNNQIVTSTIWLTLIYKDFLLLVWACWAGWTCWIWPFWYLNWFIELSGFLKEFCWILLVFCWFLLGLHFSNFWGYQLKKPCSEETLTVAQWYFPISTINMNYSCR